MSRRGVSGWMFLLVPAHPGRPGQRAVKRLCVCVCVCDRPSIKFFDLLFKMQAAWCSPSVISYQLLSGCFVMCLSTYQSLWYWNLICGDVLFCSIILESDPILVAQRVAFRSDDIPLGEQTVASVCFLALYSLFEYFPCFIGSCFQFSIFCDIGLIFCCG